MPKIKAIIFDLNGLFLTSDYLSQRVEDKFGINKDYFWEELQKLLVSVRDPNRTSSDIWQPVADLLNLTIPDFLEFWFSGEKLDSEFMDFAKKLKADGFQIFILSNSLKERIEYYKKHFTELFTQFDGVYFSTETGFIKPDPKAFENILIKNNLEPNECLYFDDTPGHVQSAINLGIKSRVFENIKSTGEFISQNSI